MGAVAFGAGGGGKGDSTVIDEGGPGLVWNWGMTTVSEDRPETSKTADSSSEEGTTGQNEADQSASSGSTPEAQSSSDGASTDSVAGSAEVDRAASSVGASNSVGATQGEMYHGTTATITNGPEGEIITITAPKEGSMTLLSLFAEMGMGFGHASFGTPGFPGGGPMRIPQAPWHWPLTHYGRNWFNPTLHYDQLIAAGWTKAVDERSIYHRNDPGYGNEKWVAPDGHGELVFDEYGNLVTDPANMGTYNYGTNDLTHAVLDVIPYMIWGNTSDDPTPLYYRVWGADSSGFQSTTTETM